MTRRLAAILAADVVGYSRLMGENEASTLSAVTSTRRRLLEPRLVRHGGRIVKLMGDGLLAEFPSAVEAVRCAVAVQVESGRGAHGADASPPLQLRIGVNIGDVVVERGDIFGDGVNVAARLQAMAEPGGICVSRSVVEQLRGRLDLTLTHLGERSLKNIAEPVSVYQVDLDDRAAAVAAHADRARPPRRLPVALMAMLGVALALPVAGILWHAGYLDPLAGAPVRELDPGSAPTLAVLPFVDRSDAADQGWFVEGLTEDLITDLGRVPGLRVIGRNSVLAFKDRDVDTREIADRLGASHILDGSLRSDGQRIRINATLIDAASRTQVWAERFDEDMDDVFVLQDRVVAKITSALLPSLAGDAGTVSRRAETENVEAYEQFLKGWQKLRLDTSDGLPLARSYFEEAVRLDPDFGRAWAALALTYFHAFDRGWAGSLGIGASMARLRAGNYLARALEHPTALSHRVAAEMFLRAGRIADARTEAKLAVAAEPKDADSRLILARTLLFGGDAAGALAELEAVRRAEVLPPVDYEYLLGLAHFGQDRLASASEQMAAVLAREPGSAEANGVAAAALALLGRPADARQRFDAFVAATERQGPLHSTPFSDYTLGRYWPYVAAADWERLLRGLSLAAGREPDFTGGSSRGPPGLAGAGP